MTGIYESFLQTGFVDAMELADDSEGRLQVCPQPPFPPSRYALAVSVPSLRRSAAGTIEVVTDQPVLLGVSLPEWYLRSTDPHLTLSIVSVLTPRLVHPNVRGSLVCLGSRLRPGTALRVLLYELYEVIGHRNLGLDERNAFEPEACRLLRAHPDLLARLVAPPLRGRRPALRVTVSAR